MSVRRPSTMTRRSRCARTAREDEPLHVTPHPGHLLGAHLVIHARHVLLDDRPLIQVPRRIVRRRADELHAARVRLVVRLRALERGQEPVVDVDDGRPLIEHLLGEDSHVPRQHDEIDMVPFSR